MLSDIEIIKQSKMKNITSVIEKYDILEDEISLYGKNIAKIDLSLLKRLEDKKDGSPYQNNSLRQDKYLWIAREYQKQHISYIQSICH